MKIAALQMVSTPRVDENLDTARALIAEAAAQGAGLVALPEYFCFIGPNDRDKLAIAEAPGDGPIQQALSDAARRHGVWVIGGTLPIRVGSADRALNASCVYAPDGGLAARYDKMHLFRYDNGRERYDEAQVLDAGAEPVAFDAGALRVGLSVCYDLRFPELYRQLTFAGARRCDLLAVPAAFTYTTGRAHWELLLRARSRTSATSSRRRRAACTKPAAAPGATAWSSTRGAMSWPRATKAPASSSPSWTSSASRRCDRSCRRWNTGAAPDPRNQLPTAIRFIGWLSQITVTPWRTAARSMATMRSSSTA